MDFLILAYFTGIRIHHILKKNLLKVLNKAKLVGIGLCHGKNDYGGNKFIFCGLFLALEKKILFGF